MNAAKVFTAIDLFSGCGGLSEGLRQAGFSVIGAIENDALAVETYRLNHTNVKVWESDITKVRPGEVMRALDLDPGDLDLLAGCPPCQGFSTMTTLNGRHRMRDDRNDLVFQFLRFVARFKPKAIMMENVPGLARNHRMRRLKHVLKTLGYECEVKVLDAAHYGVPQRRRRMILLGSRFGSVPFARPAGSTKTVREALMSASNGWLKRDALHNLPEKRAPEVIKRIRRIPLNGGSRLDLPLDDQLDCHRRCDGFKDVFGRMSWDAVAPTITGGCCNPSKGRFLHPAENRCITLREAALLQSFRPGYRFSVRRGKFPAAQLIGNALPPEFVRRHALGIRRVLLKTSRDGVEQPGRTANSKRG